MFQDTKHLASKEATRTKHGVQPVITRHASERGATTQDEGTAKRTQSDTESRIVRKGH